LPEESVWPPAKGTVSPEEEARLRSLGYSAGSERRKASYTAEDDPKKLIDLDRKIHQVVQARPQMSEGYEHLALALRQLERHDEAIAVLREGVRRAGGKESLQRQLGLALSEAGQAREAVEVLQPLADGTDSATLNALGIALSDSGRQAEAEAALRRVVERYPSDPKGYENLGIVLLRMDRIAEARDALRKALDFNPGLPIAWNTLGVALY